MNVSWVSTDRCGGDEKRGRCTGDTVTTSADVTVLVTVDGSGLVSTAEEVGGANEGYLKVKHYPSKKEVQRN